MREQIQRQILGFLGSFLFAITSYAAAEQPFSHKRHAPLKMRCISCHENAERAERAGFPAVKQCKVCHVDMAGRTIPSSRIYEIPEFVFFSHARHAAAKVGCKSCHGDVALQETLKAEQQIKMKWCVDCHKQNKASIVCNKCHELGQ